MKRARSITVGTNLSREACPARNIEREMVAASRQQNVVRVKFGGKQHEVDSDLLDALSSALDTEATDVAESSQG